MLLSFPGYFPFDILLVIFSYYEEDPPGYPLENLLLVCRSWNAAVLECRHVWSSLTNVDVRSPEMGLFWASQIPRRIKRSGAHSPIDFSLRLSERWPVRMHPQCALFVAEGKTCDCSIAFKQNIKAILEGVFALKSEGEQMPQALLCGRWRRIEIHWFDSDVPINLPFFSYPTPQLTSLILQNVQEYQPIYEGWDRHLRTNFGFIPSAPRLKHIEMIDCNFSLPDLSKAKLVHFVGHSRNDLPMVLSGLDHAIHLRTLHLGVSGGDYQIPANLPRLEVLYLEGGYNNMLPLNIDQVQLPVLRHLSLVFDGYEGRNGRPVQTLLGCHGILFHQLKSLHVEFGHETRMRCRFSALDGRELEKKNRDEHWNSYKVLLQACTALQRLSGNDFSVMFFLKLLKEDCMEKGEGVFSGHSFILANEKKLKRRLSLGKEEKLHDLDFLAIGLGLLEIEDDRGEFLGHFRGGLVYR